MIRFFRNMKMGNKFLFSLLSITIFFVLISIYQVYSLRHLRILNRQSGEDRLMTTRLVENNTRFSELYPLIMEAIVRKNPEVLEDSWVQYRIKSEDFFMKLQNDLPKGDLLDRANEAENAFRSLEVVYNQRIIPFFNSIESSDIVGGFDIMADSGYADTTVVESEADTSEMNLMSDFEASFDMGIDEGYVETTGYLPDQLLEIQLIEVDVRQHLNTIHNALSAIAQHYAKTSDEFWLRYNSVETRLIWVTVILVVLAMLVAAALLMVFHRLIVRPIIHISQAVNVLSRGAFVGDFSYDSKDEIGQTAKALEALNEGLKRIALYAEAIEKENFNATFEPLSDEDTLGAALLQLGASLKESAEKEEIRKKEDEQRNWGNQGIAVFSDILRQHNTNINELAIHAIKTLINYLKVNQGGFFVLNDENPDDPYYELKASYAYDRQKFLTRHVRVGEGLVGAVAVEKASTYLTQIPEDYIEITSGLGTANPTALLIVPLKLDDNVLGIIELASFNELLSYEIEFVEKVAENIASTLLSVRINEKTSKLLEQTKVQAEEMAAQEEEMRQNMEELQATQEEAARKTEEMDQVLEAVQQVLGTVMLSENGLVLEVNDMFCKWFNSHPAFYLGKHLSDLPVVPDSEEIEYDVLWAQLRNGMSYTTRKEYMFLGKKLVFDEFFSPIRDTNGDVAKVLVMIRELAA